jgi:predicted phage terminase large subunit-like protein
LEELREAARAKQAEQVYEQAREEKPISLDPFGDFEKEVTPEFTWDWKHLRFCRQVLYRAERRKKEGGRFRVIVCMPPQHGKTEQHTIRYAAYRLKENPELRIGIASYNQKRANKLSRQIRKLVRLAGMKIDREAGQVNDWRLAGHRGGIVAVGAIKGGIHGEPVDMMIVDDVIGRKIDNNTKYWKNVAEWWREDIYPRIQSDGDILIVNTPWHVDDLISWIIKNDKEKQFEVINLPAYNVADYPEFGLTIGEPLCPELHPREDLEDKRARMGAMFDLQYLLIRFEKGGKLFPISLIKVLPVCPHDVQVVARGWDKAATEDGGDYSAGVKVGKNGYQWIVINAKRGQWNYAERENVIRQTAFLDQIQHSAVINIIEQEPSGSGKESAQRSILNLSGFHVLPEKTIINKLTNWSSFASQVQAGNVAIVAGDWNQDFLDELEMAPRGSNDDQIDGAVLAFNYLALESNGATLENIATSNPNPTDLTERISQEYGSDYSSIGDNYR